MVHVAVVRVIVSVAVRVVVVVGAVVAVVAATFLSVSLSWQNGITIVIRFYLPGFIRGLSKW